MVLTNRSDVGKRQRLDYIFLLMKPMAPAAIVPLISSTAAANATVASSRESVGANANNMPTTAAAVSPVPVLASNAAPVAANTAVTSMREGVDINANMPVESIVSAREGAPHAGQVHVQLRDARVQPFYVQHPLFTQLSDHYGVSANLTFLKQ